MVKLSVVWTRFVISGFHCCDLLCFFKYWKDEIRSGLSQCKLLFIAGNVITEGDINGDSELSGTMFVSFTAPSLYFFLLSICCLALCMFIAQKRFFFF